MSSQKAIAAVRQFAPAKDNGVSFVKELTIGLVLGLAAGAVWKVDLRPAPPPPLGPSFSDPGVREPEHYSMPFPRRGCAATATPCMTLSCGRFDGYTIPAARRPPMRTHHPC